MILKLILNFIILPSRFCWEKSLWVGGLFAKRLLALYDKRNRDIFRIISQIHDSPKVRKKEVRKVLYDYTDAIVWSNSGAFLGIFFALCAVTYIFPLAIIEHIPHHALGGWTHLYKMGFVLLVFPAMTFVNLCIVLPILLEVNQRRVRDYLTPIQYAEVSMNNLSGSEMLTFLACEYWNVCHGFQSSIKNSKSLHGILRPYLQGTKIHAKDEEFISQVKIWLAEDTLEKALKDLKKYKQKLDVDVLNCLALQGLLIERTNTQERELIYHVLKFSVDILVPRLNAVIYELESLIPPRKNDAVQVEKIADPLRKCFGMLYHMWSDMEQKRKPRLESIILWNDLHETIMGMASLSSTAWSLGNYRSKLTHLAGMLLSEGQNERAANATIDRIWTLVSSSKAHFGIDMMIHLERFCFEVRKEAKDFVDLPKLLKQVRDTKAKGNVATSGGKIIGWDVKCFENLAKSLLELDRRAKETRTTVMTDLGMNFEQQIKRIHKQNEDSAIYLVLFGYSKTIQNCLVFAGDLLRSRGIRLFLFNEGSHGNFNTKLMRYEIFHSSSVLKDVSSFIGSKDFFLSNLRPKDTVVILAGTEVFDLTFQRLYHTTGSQERLESMCRNLKSLHIEFDTWVLSSDYKVYPMFPDLNTVFGEEFYRDHYWRMEVFDLKLKEISHLVITNDCVYRDGEILH